MCEYCGITWACVENVFNVKVHVCSYVQGEYMNGYLSHKIIEIQYI